MKHAQHTAEFGSAARRLNIGASVLEEKLAREGAYEEVQRCACFTCTIPPLSEGTQKFSAIELQDSPFRINTANGTCNVNPDPQEPPKWLSGPTFNQI